jgi:transposase
MDFHLDTLLNFPNATVEQCIQEAGEIFLTLRLLNDAADCPNCGQLTEELHQSRPVLLRDLSIFGQATHLKIPRRQFYCRACQRYFTESLPYVDKGRQYTCRYEEYIYQQVQLTTIEQVSRMEGLTYDRVEGIFNHQYEFKKKRVGLERNESQLMKSVTGKDSGTLPPLSETLRLGDSWR